MNNWKETILYDFMEINPTTRLREDFEYSFIEMADLEASNKLVRPKRKRKPKGLTKFKNGDTLFAKITPCLENGKICQVAGLKDGVGCGSTEFIVLRGKEGVSDSSFVYYLSKYSVFRNYAIKNMGGTAGQQRVPTSIFNSLMLPLPSLPEQKQVAAVLSSLDDKIELLRRQNETLEKIAQGIFKEWFVNFKIDGKKLKLKNGVPEGWRVGKLKDCIDFVIDNRGKTPPIIERLRDSVPMVEVNALTRESRIIDMDQCKKYVDQHTFNTWFRRGHPDAGDILISTVGSIGQLAQVFDEKICIAQNIIALRHAGFSNYLYGLLKDIQKEIISIDISSVQPSIKVPHLLNIEIFMPPKEIKVDFEKNIAPFSEKIHCNNSQIQTLSRLRDTLLPKLMSGEIKI